MTDTIAKKRILLAFSGGVDSAVAAHLLINEGYDIEAVYMIMSDAHLTGISTAESTAAELGINLRLLDLRKEFEEKIVAPFCSIYCEGKTPNPCVICNAEVKFQAALKLADSLSIEKIATGHYARIESVSEKKFIRRAACLQRDQSYMLYRLSQNQIARTVFPLGEIDKTTVRGIALSLGLSAAKRPDSQDICFIPDGDYVRFIKERGYSSPAGDFISPDGVNLCKHDGLLNYTVGQRRGLHIPFGERVFVKRIDSDGTVFLGREGEQYSSCILLENCVFHKSLEAEHVYSVKIRSRAAFADARIDTHTAEITFLSPQRAVAPGQSAVIYENDFVVAGGIIKKII